MSQHDLLLADAPGLAYRTDAEAAVKALASCSSGPTPPATPYACMLWLDTSVPPNGQLRMRNPANSAWIDIVGFPGKASSAETIAGIDDTKFVTSYGVAQVDAATPRDIRNRVVNGAMQHSQENGDTALTAAGYYPADQFALSASAAYLNVGRVWNAAEGRYEIFAKVAAPAASLAAGDYAVVLQRIEGMRIADFQWGLAAAKQVVLRFGWRSTKAGTFYVTLKNSTGSVTYLKSFVVAAGDINKDLIFTIPIPGPTVGTWLTDTGSGVQIAWAFASGSTYIGTVDAAWNAGSYLAGPGQTNGVATLNDEYRIFEVGLYLDADATGIAPTWEPPDFIAESWACQRYFCQVNVVGSQHLFIAANVIYVAGYLPVDQRTTAPTAAGVNQSAGNFSTTVGAFAVLSPRSMREGRTGSAIGAGYFQTLWSLNARM